MAIPQYFQHALDRAHPSWHGAIMQGLDAIDAQFPDYLSTLSTQGFLPTEQRIFAAFSVPLDQVKFVLVGEGPYPRSASATGYCFMDGAVASLWSVGAKAGLSTAVNKATSLRNFMKMLLVADQRLDLSADYHRQIADIAHQAMACNSNAIITLAQLQENFLSHGFLMLNAALVFRESCKPALEVRFWAPFLACILHALTYNQAQAAQPRTLILWGRLADQLRKTIPLSGFKLACSEHPYNLSFIQNQSMQTLFVSLNLLKKTDKLIVE